MKKTKKVSSTGRFGSRYGVGIKKRVLKVEEKQRDLSVCPFCGFKKIKRKIRFVTFESDEFTLDKIKDEKAEPLLLWSK